MSVSTLSFLGATRTVTGSKFLIETDAGRRVLVDCGLFQGFKERRLRNWAPFPVPPESIDAILLTHAHIDHCGYIPRLVKMGFSGPVYATADTRRLAAIVLPDSGHLQEKEAEYANRKGYSKHKPALPLYTRQEAVASLEQFRDVPFDRRTRIVEGLDATFRWAGHILGSASIDVDLTGPSGARRVVFSGDLGRSTHPLLRPA
ncbi:MAG TPA: MBL fold metallo-hydrolase, partial [Acidimicrobiales bacterium]|nr:MBL fold metallo-hydrolase [Acidimicrobiales bacterium]